MTFLDIKVISLEMEIFYGMKIGIAGLFFFDGTFENYPSTFGPYIESKYFVDKLDSSPIDSNQTSSYFDWVQGDYYLDNLDIGVKYSKK